MPARPSYSRRADIPADVLASLNRGEEATQTLAEGLAIDFSELLRAAMGVRVEVDPSLGITRRMEIAAAALSSAQVTAASQHASDTVRGWAAYAIGRNEDQPLRERLARLVPFAEDPHFGVREWAWLAVRPAIVVEPLVAVEVLSSWSESPAAFRRRFASEATRPRGVWCGHIELFKADPSLALPLLEPLRADPEKYVQDSVGNWLNDAAKSQPDWVRSLCRSWTRHRPPAAATTKICKRALRSLS